MNAIADFISDLIFSHTISSQSSVLVWFDAQIHSPHTVCWRLFIVSDVLVFFAIALSPPHLLHYKSTHSTLELIYRFLNRTFYEEKPTARQMSFSYVYSARMYIYCVCVCVAKYTDICVDMYGCVCMCVYGKSGKTRTLHTYITTSTCSYV